VQIIPHKGTYTAKLGNTSNKTGRLAEALKPDWNFKISANWRF